MYKLCIVFDDGLPNDPAHVTVPWGSSAKQMPFSERAGVVGICCPLIDSEYTAKHIDVPSRNYFHVILIPSNPTFIQKKKWCLQGYTLFCLISAIKQRLWVPVRTAVLTSTYILCFEQKKQKDHIFSSETFIWPRGYKTFFMLNSAEHEIFPANNHENANYCWYFHIY